MDLLISNKSDKPIYEQLYEQISGQIASGGLPPDFCLPSIRTVSKELSISVITVKKAYEELERAGFIYTRAGKGCFVAEQPRDAADRRIGLAADRLRDGVAYAKSLGLTEEELQVLLRRLYLS